MELLSWVQYVVREKWAAEVFDVELMKPISIQKKMISPRYKMPDSIVPVHNLTKSHEAI